MCADQIIVTSPSNLVVVFVFLSTLRRSIYDAGWPVLDGVNSRANLPLKKFAQFKYYILDFLSFKLSKKVFLETSEQVSRVRKNFYCKKSKLFVLYTGFNENRVPTHTEQSVISKRPQAPIRVLFRGGPQPESGLDIFVETVKFFELDSRFLFQIIGPYPKLSAPLKNLEIVGRDIPENKLFKLIHECDIMVGQIGSNKRLDWTIPNRFFEAAYFKKPYLALQRGTMLTFSELGMVATIDPKSSVGMVELLLDYSSNRNSYVEIAQNLNTWYLSFASSCVLSHRLLNELF